jgi:hypothetical protein
LYYLLDNLVFYSNIGLLSETFLGNISIKSLKQIFSLFRNITKSILDIKKYKNLINLEKDLKEEINKVSNSSDISKVEEENKKAFYLSAIKEAREKLNYIRLCLAHNAIRIVLILCSLKINPFYYIIHPIISSLLAVLHSLIAFYKEIKEIKTQIDSEDRTNKYIKHFDSVLNYKELNNSESHINLKNLIIEYNKKYQISDSFKRKSTFNIQENYLIPEKDNMSSSSDSTEKNGSKFINKENLNERRNINHTTIHDNNGYFYKDDLQNEISPQANLSNSNTNKERLTNKSNHNDLINSNNSNSNKPTFKRSNMNLNISYNKIENQDLSYSKVYSKDSKNPSDKIKKDNISLDKYAQKGK